MYVCSTWSSTVQSTARAIRKHAEPSVLCSSRGALMSYNDRSACAVPLHQMTSYTFKAGARKQNHDGGRGSNLHVFNPSCWENMTKHDWNGMQSNIALYFISESVFFCSFCWTFDYYIHVQVQGFGTWKFHGSRYFKYTLCMCMLLK